MRAKVPTSGPPKHMEHPESLTNINTGRLTGSERAGGRRDTEKAELRSLEVREGRLEVGVSEMSDTGESEVAGGWWRATRLT